MKIAEIPLILLAAGASQRMGFPKGLIDFRGKKLLEYQINSFFNHGGKEIIIVLGHHLEKYQVEFPWLKKASHFWTPISTGQLLAPINPLPEQGQFSSLQIGIEAFLKIDRPAAFISPLDLPSPEQKIWKKLANGSPAKWAASIPCHQGKGGHPILLQRPFLKQLAQLDPSSSEARLDHQIRRLPLSAVQHLEVESTEILANINTLYDLENIDKNQKDQ